MRRARARIGDRFDVVGFIPPVRMVEIAKERTEGFVGAYLAEGARTGHLSLLAQSCYMQGINDAAEALLRGGRSDDQ